MTRHVLRVEVNQREKNGIVAAACCALGAACHLQPAIVKHSIAVAERVTAITLLVADAGSDVECVDVVHFLFKRTHLLQSASQTSAIKCSRVTCSHVDMRAWCAPLTSDCRRPLPAGLLRREQIINMKQKSWHAPAGEKCMGRKHGCERGERCDGEYHHEAQSQRAAVGCCEVQLTAAL